MTERTIRTALISSDRSFREMVRDVFLSHEAWTAPAIEIAAPFSSFGENELRAVRQLHPELIILDLADEPELGIRLAHFLSEAAPGQRFVAVGPHLSPELLLSAMRAGVADYLPRPVTAEAFQTGGRASAAAAGSRQHGCGQGARPAAVPSTAPRAAPAPPRSPPISPSCCIGSRGKKTLLVDLDLELGEIALLLGMQPRFNFVDMVQNFHRMDAELLASFIERHESGVHLLSAPYQPEKAEVVTGDADPADPRLPAAALRLRAWWTPPSRSRRPRWRRSSRPTWSFLVTNADLPSLRNIQRGLPLLRRMLGRGEDQFRLVVNRYNVANDDLARRTSSAPSGSRCSGR